MLKVKKLHPEAIAPSLSHPGEDIGYDLHAIETTFISPGAMKSLRTGIAVEFVPKAGAVIGCRSGLAKQGASVEGGWIDAGYRGEVIVMLRNNHDMATMRIEKGDRIAQFRRVRVADDLVVEADELGTSVRDANGFGSTGK